ncbi:hypothetical protein C7271_09620 [filamentous cyanobacterium CCP5]|nr:hypothetical protein C7271_09620 [filamentous cyanobacterium CCP5]
MCFVLRLKTPLRQLFHVLHWLLDSLQGLMTWCLRNTWLRLLIRLGFAAKGCVYGLIGAIALASLWQPQTPISGTYGVLIEVLQQAFGKLLLAMFALGLMGYVLWRIIQAGLAPERDDSVGVKQVVQRTGYLISAAAYWSIAKNAGQLALGFIPEEKDTLEDVAATLLEHQPGIWLLLFGGLLVLGVGLGYIYGGLAGGYLPCLRYLPRRYRDPAHVIGQIGFTARGVGFVLISGYIIKAAFLLDQDSVAQLGEVLERLDDQPHGWLWLSAIAFGFMAYAVYMVIVSLYRQIPE